MHTKDPCQLSGNICFNTNSMWFFTSFKQGGTVSSVTKLAPVVRINEAKCNNCYACITACPVKLCMDGSGEKLLINTDLCIGCGNCIDACSHKARLIIDDTPHFFDALKQGTKVVAIVAPAIASFYPGRFLNFNGYLKSLGIDAAFDVSFGAELTVTSYLDYIKTKNPRMVISQPCPAIVNFIQIYHPKLLPYLAPVDSPMLHTIKMIREYYPQYRDHKIAVISPCIAKRREFDETGMADYNVTMFALKCKMDEQNLDLGSFPAVEYEGPKAERAVRFSSPGGLVETAERLSPGIGQRTLKIEGIHVAYPCLEEISELLDTDIGLPLLLDCLNCEKGCNGGPGTGNIKKSMVLLENPIRERSDKLEEYHKTGKGKRYAKRYNKLVSRYWKKGLYDRKYRDYSGNNNLKDPSGAQLTEVYHSLRKYKPEDIHDCTACGYGTCKAMATAIFNKMNKPENCAHYNLALLQEANQFNQVLIDIAPYFIGLWDENGNIKSASKQAINMFGIPDPQVLVDKFFTFSPEFQPCGTPSPTKAIEFIDRTYTEESVQFEWMHMTANGEPLPSECTLKRFTRKGKDMLVSYTMDLRKITAAEKKVQEAMEALRHREKLLNTVNQMAAMLLAVRNSDSFDRALTKGMEMIGKCLEADRVQLWSANMQTDGMTIYLKNQWRSQTGMFYPQIGLSGKIPYGTLPKLEELFLGGEDFNGPVANLPPEEQQFMNPHNALKSIVIIPVFLYEQFWGFFMIDDCVNERTLSSKEMDILRSASLIITSTYHRINMATIEQETNELNRVLIDAAPYVVGLWDENGNIISASKQAIDMFGVPDPQMIVDNFFMISPEFQPCGTPTPEKAAEQIGRAYTEDYAQFEWMHKTAGNEPLPAECIFKRFRRKGKDMLVSYTKDLREIKAAEKKAQEAIEALKYRERLLNTVKQAAEVLLTASEKDTLKALMKGMEIVGHCLDVDRVQIWRNEMIDGELHFVMRHEWLSEIGKQKIEVPIGLNAPYSGRDGWLEMFLRGESINQAISKLPPKDAAFLGYYEMLSIVILPLFLDQEFIGFFSIDDCQRERVFTGDEMDIIASAGLMFTSVFNKNQQAEKIAETNKQLEVALEQALSASRAKGNFLSTMSHEMRTPMNAIIGMTTIAKNEEDNDRKHYALNRVEKAAHHLLGIINDVLDISKIEANKLKLRHVEIDLRDLLQRVVSLVELRMEEKRQRFSMNMDNNVPFFYAGDDQCLTQITTNLLTNAVLYTQEEGEISLAVSLEKKEGELCELRFEVADNGAGISPEHQKRLFGMFERADNSASSSHGGTGLGLSISKRLVELMGGNISVESELGKGSTFIFTVKLLRIEQDEANGCPHSASDPAELSGNVKFTGKRLLLVEDMEINREILIAQLDGTGLLIDTAENGREAVEMVTANPSLYDLVFMDMRMPEMDGIEATWRIRSLPFGKELPIIAMTANVFTDDVESCFAAGMNDHIGKPLDMRVVFEKLRKYLPLD